MLSFTEIIDDEKYTCEVLDFRGKSEIETSSDVTECETSSDVTEFETSSDVTEFETSANIKLDNDRFRPKEISSEWFENELLKSFFKDLTEPFYFDNKERMGALLDVYTFRSLETLAVFNEAGYLIGKVCLHFNDATKTLNIMYLYVTGFRRNKNYLYEKNKNKPLINFKSHIPGAYVVWLFAARVAVEKYGNNARVLVCYPFATIVSYLIEVGGKFVMLKNSDSKIEITSMGSLIRSEDPQKALMQSKIEWEDREIDSIESDIAWDDDETDKNIVRGYSGVSKKASVHTGCVFKASELYSKIRDKENILSRLR